MPIRAVAKSAGPFSTSEIETDLTYYPQANADNVIDAQQFRA